MIRFSVSPAAASRYHGSVSTRRQKGMRSMHILLLAAGILAGSAPALPAPAAPAVRIDGKWVLDAKGTPVPPREFERGLQTGALVLRKGLLWSIGDQRAEWPGQILRIDPATARLAGGPIRPELGEAPGGKELRDAYRSVWNPDYEGLAGDPLEPDVLWGVTEDKWTYLVRFRIEGEREPKATIDRIAELEFPGVGLFPRESTNYRLEGLAFSDDGKTIYLAWERTADERPRIFRLGREEALAGKPLRPAELPVDFEHVGLRADKPKALLNVNDIAFLRREGRPVLIAVARDQERLLRIDLESGKVDRIVDLDFRAPGGDPILWTSPEGIAIDPAGDRLWLITDPDSVRGMYRRPGDAPAEGNFAALAPILFEAKLSALFPED